MLGKAARVGLGLLAFAILEVKFHFSHVFLNQNLNCFHLDIQAIQLTPYLLTTETMMGEKLTKNTVGALLLNLCCEILCL